MHVHPFELAEIRENCKARLQLGDGRKEVRGVFRDLFQLNPPDEKDHEQMLRFVGRS